nr:alpha/beta hydrolase-fold protein [Hyphomonas sp. Mor2]
MIKKNEIELQSARPSFEAVFPTTDYYEIQSKHVGARFAVWVTKPATFDPDHTGYPAIYAPDGNMFVGTASNMGMLATDPINPLKPFLLISVGYVGKDATNIWAVRSRDLLPPDEPLGKSIENKAEWIAGMEATGLLDREGIELYWHYLQNPAGDNFTQFLEEELHPAIAASYPIEPSKTGLYGFSFGGLYATYLAMRRSSLFKTIGAGSPGIMAGRSRVLAMYDQHIERQTDFSGYDMLLGVMEREITVPSPYQDLVAAGTTEFMQKANRNRLQGWNFCSEIFANESHATGSPAVWHHFLREFYSAKSAD